MLIWQCVSICIITNFVSERVKLTKTKNTEPESIFTVLRFPVMICPFRSADVWHVCPKDSAQLAQTSVWILVSLGEYLRTYLKDHIRYNQGPEIHDEPRRVSLSFGKPRCLKV